VNGAAVLAASLLGGWLWDWAGPQSTFLAGGGFAALAACALVLLRPRTAR
jgi:hypothetical protein